jgi:hypothetical protein
MLQFGFLIFILMLQFLVLKKKLITTNEGPRTNNKDKSLVAKSNNDPHNIFC